MKHNHSLLLLLATFTAIGCSADSDLSTNGRSANAKPAPEPSFQSWTDEDTENYWAEIAETATRTSTEPRFAETDEAKGEGVLKTFGTQYLPNAYAHYQKVRAAAKEREQMLKDKFPEGRPSDPADGELYDKVCKDTTKTVAEMFRRHDELCHYLLLHRMGAVSDRELTDLDATRISIVLPHEYGPPGPCNLMAPVLATAEIDFASKYLPETHAAFLRLGNAFSESAQAFGEWKQTALLVDAPRSFPLFVALYSRLYNIQEVMNETVKMVKEQKRLHAIGETTETALAEADKEKGLSVQQIEKDLAVGPSVVRGIREFVELAKHHSILFIAKSMVKIPGKPFLMGKYEVTQAQWEMVMGENPSEFEGADNPVENVSWDTCQRFVEKLNALPSVQKSGLVFRLPTEDEWEYACRAGATGNYCRLADGTEITKGTLGEVAWFWDNADRKTHPVGQKQPNAFGLYDMHGNVCEWTDTAEVIILRDREGEDYRFHANGVSRGGSIYSSASLCGASNRIIVYQNQCGDWPFNQLGKVGFRLCASCRAD
jgi:formylglycine-generating enzyme required for sulfatase activity